MTAVEWLEKEFVKLESTIGVHGVMYEIIEQAKEMENKNAVLFAKEYDEYLFRGCGLPRLTAEQYYNQTFKKD